MISKMYIYIYLLNENKNYLRTTDTNSEYLKNLTVGTYNSKSGVYTLKEALKTNYKKFNVSNNIFISLRIIHKVIHVLMGTCMIFLVI